MARIIAFLLQRVITPSDARIAISLPDFWVVKIAEDLHETYNTEPTEFFQAWIREFSDNQTF